MNIEEEYETFLLHGVSQQVNYRCQECGAKNSISIDKDRNPFKIGVYCQDHQFAKRMDVVNVDRDGL